MSNLPLGIGIRENQFVPDWVEKKFIRLRDQWKSQCGHESDPSRLSMHPAYLKIIGMGQDAIPLLLRELATDPDLWFLALRSITEEDPVPHDARGNVAEMAKAWLDWGKESGLTW
jgi:hypothetical protein